MDKNSRFREIRRIMKKLKTKGRNESIVGLTAREVFTLYLSKGPLRPLENTPLYKNLKSIFTKIEDRVGESELKSLNEISEDIEMETTNRWGIGLDSDIVESLRAGITGGHTLEIVYEDEADSKPNTYHLGPHYLYLAKGSLHLVAEDLKTERAKVFSVRQIVDVEVSDCPYKGGVKSPDEFLRASFGLFHSKEPVDVHLQFQSPITSYVRERTWHSSQNFTDDPSGLLVMRLNVSLSPEFVRWVLGFGSLVKVIAPIELQTQVVQDAKNVVEQYNSPFESSGDSKIESKSDTVVPIKKAA